jgi:hypothetical protein
MPVEKEDRMQTKPALKSDLDGLLDLNRDYIRSVQTSDVSRFAEMLAEDAADSSTTRWAVQS